MIDEKWLFDYIDALPEDSPSRIVLVNMYVAWRKEQESRTNEKGHLWKSTFVE